MKLKKLVVFILVAVLMFANNTNQVSASSKAAKVNIISVKNNTKAVKVKVNITNKSKKDITYSQEFYLYKKVKGKWKAIEWKENVGFNDLKVVILSGKSKKRTFILSKNSLTEKMKKNTQYMIKFKVAGKKKNIKFEL